MNRGVLSLTGLTVLRLLAVVGILLHRWLVALRLLLVLALWLLVVRLLLDDYGDFRLTAVVIVLVMQLWGLAGDVEKHEDAHGLARLECTEEDPLPGPEVFPIVVTITQDNELPDENADACNKGNQDS